MISNQNRGCGVSWVFVNLYKLNDRLEEIIRYNNSVELRNKKFDDILKKMNNGIADDIEEALRQEELKRGNFLRKENQ